MREANVGMNARSSDGRKQSLPAILQDLAEPWQLIEIFDFFLIVSGAIEFVFRTYLLAESVQPLSAPTFPHLLLEDDPGRDEKLKIDGDSVCRRFVDDGKLAAELFGYGQVESVLCLKKLEILFAQFDESAKYLVGGRDSIPFL